MRPLTLPALICASLSAALPAWPSLAAAWDLSGTKQIALHTRDGRTIPIGTVTFAPSERGARFTLALDRGDFRDFFLSMREFKCLEGPELQCYVAYPYDNPKTVTKDDLSWLEHSLLFFFKAPADYGAKLSNGLYYALKITDEGIVGVPQAIDLNDIASPPQDPSVPPFGPSERTELTPGSRWIERLSIR